MRIIAVTAAFCGFLLPTPARTLPVRNAATPQAQQELATILRSLLELPSVTTDPEARTLTIGGTDPQITAAEWLLAEIDRPAPAPGGKPFASAPFRGPATPGESLRVFYVRGGQPPQQLQEAATAIRSIVEIRRLFVYSQAGAIAVRGTPEQQDAAEWAWRTLASTPPFAEKEEFAGRFADGQNVLRAYRFPAGWTVQSFQGAATMIRSITEVRRIFTYNPSRTVIARGDQATMAAVSWLAAEALRPPTTEIAASELFQMEDPRGEGTISIYRMPTSRFDGARLQQLAAEIRSAAGLRRIAVLTSPNLLVLRGTSSQLEAAGKLLGSN